MLCKKCGNEPEDGDMFCSKCGETIESVDNSSENSTPQPPLGNSMLEKFRQNSYFYTSALLCFCSIMMLFSKWIDRDVARGYVSFLNGDTLVDLAELGLKTIQALFFGGGYYNNAADKFKALLICFAGLSSILILISGIRYGIALYKVYNARMASQTEMKDVLNYISKVSQFAIVAFIIQAVTFIIASSWGFSLTSVIYLLLAIANKVIVRKGKHQS